MREPSNGFIAALLAFSSLALGGCAGSFQVSENKMADSNHFAERTVDVGAMFDASFCDSHWDLCAGRDAPDLVVKRDPVTEAALQKMLDDSFCDSHWDLCAGRDAPDLVVKRYPVTEAALQKMLDDSFRASHPELFN